MVNKLIHYKKQIKILMFLFLTVSSLLVLNNSLQYNITKYHVDEVHTMNFGIKSMYSGEVTTLRVGESTRWLARAIYPVALYYMNSNMGGEIDVTGWDYPASYIRKYFTAPVAIKHDSNIQDFVFAMRFILGTLVILSFLVASYMLSITYGLIAGLAYFVFSLSTSLIYSMLAIFYTESSLIILFNLVVIFGLIKVLNWRLYIWLAFVLAFAISTKLTGLIFVLPIFTIIFLKDNNIFKGMKIEGFILLIIIFLALINIYASSYTAVMEQTLANVYHFKTGHFKTVPSGIYQIKLILKSLTPWIYIFFIASILLIIKKINNQKFLMSIAISSLIMIISLIGVHFFLDRNLTTPLIMMILIISVVFSIILKQVKDKHHILLVGSLVGLMMFHIYSINKYYNNIDANSISKYIKSCKSIATIDIEKNIIPNASVLDSMPEMFTLKKEQTSFRNKFLPYDCVVVKRVKNNKHLTNYLLPLDYKLTNRHGKYFVFKNKK
jgi:MFS family permease